MRRVSGPQSNEYRAGELSRRIDWSADLALSGCRRRGRARTEVALYRDSTEEGPIWRLLNTSWPLFTAFRVDVRVHWTIALVPLIFFSLALRAEYGFAAAALLGVASSLGLYLAVWTHEMGHIWMARQYGVESQLITLSPLGGLAHLDTGAPDPRAEIRIALAGPAAHIAWLAVAIPAYFLCDAYAPPEVAAFAEWFMWLQVALAGFNLLPFYPMDGGRTLRGILAQRMNANRASMWVAYVGIGGAALLALVGISWLAASTSGPHSGSTFGATLLIILAFSHFLRCQRLLNAIRWSDGPYEPVEEWKKGGAHRAADWSQELRESERIARAEEREEQRLAEAKEREADRRRELERRIDELLDRINEVGGVDNLTPLEQRELRETSQLLRRETAG